MNVNAHKGDIGMQGFCFCDYAMFDILDDACVCVCVCVLVCVGSIVNLKIGNLLI